MLDEVLESYFPFYKNLDESDRRELSYLSYLQSYKSDDILVQPDFQCRNVIVVTQGRLKSLLHSGSSYFQLYYLNEGEICTLAASEELYGINSRITLVASTDCTVLKSPSSTFNLLKKKYPEISIFLRRNFMDRFSDILYAIKIKGLFSTSQLVANYLYDLAINSSDDSINVTQMQISEAVAIARSQVSLILSDFEKRGIIQRSRGRIRILDVVNLQNI